MTLPEAAAERCPRCRARRIGKDPRCVQCGWRFERKETPAPRSEPTQTSEAGDDDRPPPVISPDGRLFWDGQRWIAVPRRGPSLGGVVLFIVLALAVIAGIGTSGYVDLSGLPFSVPVALEHCAVRQQGTNVIIHYQGIDAASAAAVRASAGPTTADLRSARWPVTSSACWGSAGGSTTRAR